MATKTLEIRAVLSRNVKKQRKKLGISQEKLAEITGLSVQTVNDIEGGRKWVSDKTITKLAAAFCLECYQLLVPDSAAPDTKKASSTQSLLELKKKMHKGVDTLIEAQFTDFIKAGLGK